MSDLMELVKKWRREADAMEAANNYDGGIADTRRSCADALESELAESQKREQAVQAAALRIAAEYVSDHDPMKQQLLRHSQLGTEVLALDVPGQLILDEMLAELKAQTAAMLEKAVLIVKKWNFMACSDADGLADEIHALIPTDYAAALAARVQQAVREEAELWEQEHYTESNDAIQWACRRLAELCTAAGAPEEKKP